MSAAHQCLAPRWRWAAPMGVLTEPASMGVAATKAANSGVDLAVCRRVGSLAASRSKYEVPTLMVKGVKPYMAAMQPMRESSGMRR